MKRIVLCILAVMMLVFAFGCQKKEAEPEPTATPEQTPEQTPQTTQEVIPEHVSDTTGMEVDEDYTYNPIAVMIENADGARPQTGLNQADIVYEALAESNITRFICLYNDEYPAVVGPVRSTRLYYINIAREWDAALTHIGGPSDASHTASYVYGSNSNDIKVRVDGMKGNVSKYFWRSSDRKAPHNAYTNVQKIKDDLVDYTPDERTAWKFELSKEAGKNLYSDYESFEKVSLPFISKDNFVSYQYDAATNKLYRYMSGNEFLTTTVTQNDDGTQKYETEQVCIQNLIVQYANTYELSGDTKGRRGIDLVGEGDAEFFINGKHITGTWKRTSQNDSTVYYDDKGEQIVLLPGNTWVEVHPLAKKAIVE